MIEIETINGEKFKGEFNYIRLCLWDRKRKAELTLNMDIENNQFMNIPLSQIKEIFSDKYLNELEQDKKESVTDR